MSLIKEYVKKTNWWKGTWIIGLRRSTWYFDCIANARAAKV